MTSPQPVLLHITRSSFTFFYGENESTTLKISHDVFHDLEVKDEAKLQESVQRCVESKSISKTSLYVFLDPDFTFTLDLTQMPILDRQTEIRKFTSLLPIEKVSHVILMEGKQTILVAFDLGFIETLQDLLETVGFQVKAILPLSLIVTKTKHKEKIDIASYRPKLSTLRRKSLIAPVYSSVLEAKIPAVTVKPEQRRLVALLGVFGLLLLILLITFLRSHR